MKNSQIIGLKLIHTILLILLVFEYTYFLWGQYTEKVIDSEFNETLELATVGFIASLGAARVFLSALSIIMIHRLKYDIGFFLGIYNFALLFFGLILMEILTANFTATVFFLFYITCFIILSVTSSIFYFKFMKLNSLQKINIKKLILNLGTKYIRLEILDLAEKCNTSRESIKRIILEMITKKEIHAIYQKNSNLVEFDQEVNIEEIDKIMNLYEKWESDKKNELKVK